MNFILYYLKLEFKLFNRKLLQLGFNLNIFWSIVPTILLLFAIQIIKKGDASTWILLALLSLLFQNKNTSIHQEFIFNSVGKVKITQIRIFRNFLLALPFLLALLYFNKLLQAAVLMAISMMSAIVYIPKFKILVIPTPFRNYPFEFIVGFRKYFWIWILLFPMIYLSKTYQNDSLTIVVYAAILLVHLQFFSIQEPIWYIWNEAKSTSEFLFFKIKVGMICNFISITIPTLILSCFLTNSTFIIISIWAFSFVMCAYCVLSKYAYIPNQIPALQGFLIFLNLIFPPFLLFSIPFLYKKAEQNLKHYLV